MMIWYVVKGGKRYGGFATKKDAEGFRDFLVTYNGATGLRIEVAHVTE